MAALVAGGLVYALGLIDAAHVERPVITAIAVLPLDNLSGDPSQEYFVDGMTEALIGSLARLRTLRVVSRTSVMRFKGAKPPLPEIARMLHVDGVIEGSVQRTGDLVRINVQLVHAPTDSHLWARACSARRLTCWHCRLTWRVPWPKRYRSRSRQKSGLGSRWPVQVNSSGLRGIFAGAALSVEIDRGRPLTVHWITSSRSVSIGSHEPRHVCGAFARLVVARSLGGNSARRRSERGPTRAAAAKALELGPGLSEAHVSQRSIKFGLRPGLERCGGESFKRALKESIRTTRMLTSFRRCCAWPWGAFTESIAHMKRLEERDPLSPTVQSFSGRVLYRARKFDEAIIQLQPGNRPLAPYSAAGCLSPVWPRCTRNSAGTAEALALLQKAAAARRAGLVSRWSSAKTARIYARMGKREEARAIANRSKGEQSLLPCDGVRRSWRERRGFPAAPQGLSGSPNFNVYVKTDPALDRLHSDPRWHEVLRRMKYLPDDTSTSGSQ